MLAAGAHLLWQVHTLAIDDAAGNASASNARYAQFADLAASLPGEEAGRGGEGRPRRIAGGLRPRIPALQFQRW